ncbi:MAG: Mov34/MPN/PAD-1 family protein [Candidatus Caldarchaeum sp.]
MPPKKVVIEKQCAGLLLAMAREVHPNEVIALLHGSVEKKVIRVREVYLPPQSTYGEGFSSFNPYALPIDLSYVGIAHSHPSGVGEPSIEDLHNFTGKIMLILTAPYKDSRDIHVFDAEGRRIAYEIV